MFKTRILGLYQLVQLGQIGLAVVLYWIVLGIFTAFYHPAEHLDIEHYVITCLLMVLALLASSTSSRFDSENLLQPTLFMAHDLSIRRTVMVFMFELVFIFATKNDTISRVFLFGFMPMLYFMLVMTYRFLPSKLAEVSFSGEREMRCLLCGTAAEVVRIRHWIDRKAALGFRAVGVLLTEPVDKEEIEGIRVMGRVDDFEAVIKSNQVAQVMFLHIPEPRARVAKYYRVAERYGARFVMVNDLEEIIGHGITSVDDDGVHVIGIRREPLENIWNRAVKRLLDTSVALAVVLVVMPLLIPIVWLFQRLQAPGPLFFRQRRAGLHNKEFEMIKFRTMAVNHGPEERRATAGDSRIFAFGRIMRRLSIDEIPQFLNVLKGEMSVVGPRPHLPEHNRDFVQLMGHYHVRSFVKPGITGLAQVRGFRGEPKTKGHLIARIVSDLYYIENWSLAMDVLIMIRTALQMIIPPKSAY